MKRIITAITILLCLTSCVISSDSDDEYGKGLLAAGTDAPDFMIYPDGMADGFSLSTLRGKHVILEFWASWCPDCRKATPAVKELHDTFSSDGMVFIGISFDTDEEAWRKYISDNGMSWIQHREQKPWKESPLSTAYNIRWIPTFYLIDDNGKVAFATVNAAEMREKLNSMQHIISSPQ